MAVKSSYVIGRDQPSHLGGGGELAVDEALDLGLGPPVIDVDDGEHKPFSRLELVFDAMLIAFAFYLRKDFFSRFCIFEDFEASSNLH